jgi:GNAT superfamily N-acetyltransferase
VSATFAVERFSNVYEELKPLLARHYAEISLHAARGFELKPQEHVYRAREAAGELLMMIGRERGRIVAYLVAFVAPGLHYADCLTAIGDIFYVDPDCRNARVGLQLLRATENELRRRRVALWFTGEKLKFPAAPLFRRVGMEPVEVTHAKWL